MVGAVGAGAMALLTDPRLLSCELSNWGRNKVIPFCQRAALFDFGALPGQVDFSGEESHVEHERRLAELTPELRRW